ncbi:MAG: chromosomal replication initiator protein DnaA [Candidatus Levybacteria bacterium]|nr:chromosomal replication initiator protein DnaA [Candidatus Levybacteria bacterium]
MDKTKLWQGVLSEIQLQVTEAVYKTMFAQTSLLELNGQAAKIGCGNPMLINMVEKRYYSLIKSVLDAHTKQDHLLSFVATSNSSKRATFSEPLFNQIMPNFRQMAADVKRQARLNPIFTFENFAVSSSNQMAYAAAQAVANSPGVSYNPLFLYGGVGVGKTHLMQAIGNVLIQKNSKTKVIFNMGEEFTNEIIEAIRGKTTDIFKKRYRTANLLLLDDIQFIAGKNTVQEEFFYTFNAIAQTGGQIILTSDRPPHEISRLEDRLRSRFEGGLIIDISAPDFELRTAILLIKAKQRGVDLPMEIAKLIAQDIEDTRKLEGTLIRLITEAQTKKTQIDEVLVRNVLGKSKINTSAKKISATEALSVVSEYYNLKISQIKSDKRDRPISLPRQVLYYILRIELGLPLMQIGSFMGGRDHTTIMHGVKKISQLLTKDEKIRGDILGIKERIVG